MKRNENKGMVLYVLLSILMTPVFIFYGVKELIKKAINRGKI